MKRPALATTATVAVEVLMASWVLVTATNQLPNRAFDWARKYDPSVMFIPNWRFFAPNPAVHDFRLAHRILWEDDTSTAWIDTKDIPARKLYNTVWFPSRRRDKAITDMSNSLIERMEDPSAAIESSLPYAALRNLVWGAITESLEPGGPVPKGFQFALGRDAGYDESEEPTVFFTSKFEQWKARP